eukprot:4337919-Prymnesium_polylepis.1
MRARGAAPAAGLDSRVSSIRLGEGRVRPRLRLLRTCSPARLSRARAPTEHPWSRGFSGGSGWGALRSQGGPQPPSGPPSS